MRTQHLRHKVTFYKQGDTRNAYGEIENTEVEVGQAWVQIIPLKGDERFLSQRLNTEVSHKVRLRYQDGLDSKMTFKYGERVFHIDSIIDVMEKRKELNIMATEVFGG